MPINVMTAPSMSGMITPLLTQLSKCGCLAPMMALERTKNGKHDVNLESTESIVDVDPDPSPVSGSAESISFCVICTASGKVTGTGSDTGL
jgi:hypothetical protein